MPDYTEDDVRDELRRAVEAAGSQAAWARAHDTSQGYVNDVLLGRREVSADFARKLGFEMQPRTFTRGRRHAA